MGRNFLMYAFEGLYLCEQSGIQKPQRFIEVTVQGGFSLYFYSQERKWLVVLQEERITEVFILLHPHSFFITFVLFHFLKGHKSGTK